MSQQWDPELLVGFFEEARDGLEQLEGPLVDLKSNPDNEETVARAFRTIHSIKGNSGFFGIKNLNAFCDRFENLLDHLRTNIAAMSVEVAELLLRGVDEIKSMLNAAEGGERASELTREQSAILEQVTEVKEGRTVEVSVEALLRLAGMVQSESYTALAAANEHLLELRRFVEHISVGAPAEEKDATPPAEDRFTTATWSGTDVSTPVSAIDAWLRQCEAGTPAAVPVQAFETLGSLVPDDQAGSTLVREACEQATTLADAELSTDPILISAVRESFEAFAERLELGAAVPAPDEAPPAEDAPGQAPPATHNVERRSSIRVSQERIDEFLAHVGELIVTSKNYLVIERQLAESTDNGWAAQELKLINQRFAEISQNLQRGALGLRKIPAGTQLRTIPRMVSDLAAKLEKQVRVETVGDNVEADRSTLELLKDPLTHILRNSVDHGLETPEARRAAGKPECGTVRVTASADKRFFTFTIEDDGRGIDVEHVRAKAIENGAITPQQAAAMSRQETLGLIFAAGLSTAKEQTDVSGRGVGMDVVMRNVTELGGKVTVDSVAGQGTTISIRIPLTGTLLVIGALTVEVSGNQYFIPTSYIQTLLRTTNQSAHRLPDGTEVARVNGSTHPLLRPAKVLPRNPDDGHELDVHWILIGKGQRTACLEIDRPLGIEDIVVTDLDRVLPGPQCVNGAAMTGEGRIALVLNMDWFLDGMPRLGTGTTCDATSGNEPTEPVR